MTSINNIIAGIKSATTAGGDLLKAIAIYGILPLATIVLLIFLLICVIGAAKKKKMGEDFHDDLWKAITILVVFGLVGSFTTWGWIMMGSSPADTSTLASVLVGGML